MKVQVGTLSPGSRVTVTFKEDDYVTVGRYVVGKQVQDKSGHPLIEVRRPHEKSVYDYLEADTVVDVS